MSTSRNDAARINRSGPGGHSHSLDVTWTDYVPVVAQGVTSDISKQTAYARWCVVDKMVHVQAWLNITGTGTSSQPVFVTTPVVPAFNSLVVGNGGVYYAANGAMIATLVVLHSDGRFAFRNAMVASTAYVGISPASALTANDAILLTATYPIT